MNIPKFSIDNHVLLSILLATCIALGIISISRLPQEQFAEVPFFWANIVVPYPGASADDIERSVTVKIEQEMQGLDDLKKIQSVTSAGLSVVRVEFDDGITPARFERLFQDVSTRFSRISLPDGTLQAVISDFSSNDFLPVIEIAVSGSVDYSQLDSVARALRERILTISDVSQVDLAGSKKRQIKIAADRDRLETANLALTEVLRAVQQKNTVVPGGTLETETREYLLRTVGSLSGTQDFEQVIVRRSNGSGIIHVGEIATVTDGYATSSSDVRFNGEQSILLKVTKVPNGDAIGIITALDFILAEDAFTNLGQIRITPVNDSTVQIKDSIDVLVSNAVQGLFLLTLILFFFVGLRNALMTALGIPVTFAITFIILELLGETLNSNTLFGLVLVLGMMVDHSIVLTENALRYTQSGLDRRKAAIKGTNEVIWPIVASSLTTIAAFLPLMLIPGTIGKFLRVIPLVVTVALAVSTVESILFIPSHFVHWPTLSEFAPAGAFFEKIQKKFKSLTVFLYEKRFFTVGGFSLFALLLMGSLAFVNIDLFSAEDYSLYYIDIELPVGSNRSETARIASEYEKRILEQQGKGEIVNVITSIGTGSSHIAEIVVDLEEVKNGRKRSIPAIMDEMKWRTSDIPGVENVFFRKAASGPPVSAPIGFRVRGDDYASLIAVIEGIRNRISSYPEVFNIEDSLERGTGELVITINEERSAAYGLSVASIGAFIRASYDGLPAGSVFINNEEIEILVRYADDSSAGSVTRLMEMKIPTNFGSFVPFSAVCSVAVDDGFAAIKRVDGKREVSLSAEVTDKKIVTGLNADIQAWFKTDFLKNNPSSVELVTGGEFSEFADLLIQILRVFVLGLFLIYAILGAQFKSYTQPFLILLSVPMAFAGVFFYLAISGTPFSTTVLYAAVALAGISVNDTIVMIDFINTGRAKGLTIKDAAVTASVTRLRPIMLTSVTTIAGLLPTAIGIGGYSVVWSPMASTIIFGLIFSTITAVTVVPAMYGLLFDRPKSRIRSLFAKK